MDRKRRGPDGAEQREPRQASGSPRRPPSVVDAILDLQATAGNRAVAAALGPATAQRAPRPAEKNDGGALTLGSDEAIPLQSASWSLKRAVILDPVGNERVPHSLPGRRDVGNLELKRDRDAHSARLPALMGIEHEEGSLRLERPSREGALPASTLALREAAIVAHSQGRGDDPTETLTIAIGDLKVAGEGKDAPKESARAFLQVGGGQAAWPPIPVLRWQRDEAPALPRPGRPGPRPFAPEGPPDQKRPGELVVDIAPGPGLTRLAEALDQGTHLDDVTLSPNGRGLIVRLLNALVVSVEGSSAGPSMVKVRLAGEVEKLSVTPGEMPGRRGRLAPMTGHL